MPKPDFRRRRILGAILLLGLVAPIPLTAVGAREAGLWIFAASMTTCALLIAAMPLAKLRKPDAAAQTFRPPLRRLLFDANNVGGVLAFWFELLLVLALGFVAVKVIARGDSDPRFFGPIFLFGIAALGWPIIDWFSECVHVTRTAIHVNVTQRGRLVEIEDIGALRVVAGRRAPTHGGAVLRLMLRDGGNVGLPGTVRDADTFLALVRNVTGVDVARVDAKRKPRSDRN